MSRGVRSSSSPRRWPLPRRGGNLGVVGATLWQRPEEGVEHERPVRRKRATGGWRAMPWRARGYLRRHAAGATRTGRVPQWRYVQVAARSRGQARCWVGRKGGSASAGDQDFETRHAASR
jgi:hypothetical protein